ncbi:hypothetical protein [Flaviaesturariibacter amylovorans]|uniref:Thioredoxin domain-containing protein n=1 Tax=Flaviaesturariibacter amylovorans TaxID=1084520 RepID=A0ABP8HJZ9_9BACT
MVPRFFLAVFAFLLLTGSAGAQSDSAATQQPLEPPYKRFPGLPPIDLLLIDSSTVFTTEQVKKKPVLLMVFDPNCHHCQMTAEELYNERAKLPDVQIVMATMETVSRMRAFREKYHLEAVPQVLLGKDRFYLLPPFFNISHLPFMALYNKKHELIGTFEGSLSIPKAMELLAAKGN